MPSLTPSHRAAEATSAATLDGLMSGLLTLIPSSAAVYAAMRSSTTFVRSTNWQSRTALVIMPPFFMYALSSEMKLNHKMREMASEADHSREVSEWAEKQQQDTQKSVNEKSETLTRKESAKEGVTNRQLHALYKRSVEESGVRIVPGDTLNVHHMAANFLQEHPFKILTAAGSEYLYHCLPNRATHLFQMVLARHCLLVLGKDRACTAF